MKVKEIRRAVKSPLRQLAEIAGQEGALIVQEVKSRPGNEGYHVATAKPDEMEPDFNQKASFWAYFH